MKETNHVPVVSSARVEKKPVNERSEGAVGPLPPVSYPQTACPCDGGCPCCSSDVVLGSSQEEIQADQWAAAALRPLRAPYSLSELQPRWQAGGAETPVLHTDTRAHETASALQAEAVTHGRDIYLRSDAFSPTTRNGAFLLSHEVAHTRQTGTPSVWRRHPDDEKAPALPRGVDRDAVGLNQYYWDRYHLMEANPFGGLNPYETPEEFAGLVYDLQKVITAKGYDKAVLGKKNKPDGVLGPKTFAILSAITAHPDQYPDAKAALESEGVLLQDLKLLSPDDLEAWQRSESGVWAELIQAESLGSWRQPCSSETVLDYFIQHAESGLLLDAIPAEVWDSLTLPDGSLPEVSSKAIGQVLKKLYTGAVWTCELNYLKADRPFLHRFDADKQANRKPPKGADFFLYSLIPDEKGYQDVMTELGLSVPEKKNLPQLHAAMSGTGTPPNTTGIFGALFLAYFPAKKTEEIQKALIEYFYAEKLKQTAEEEMAADWAESFQKQVDARLAGPADITSSEVLIGLLAEPGGAPVPDPRQNADLLTKASETLGLIVCIGEDSEPVFLPYSVIMKARAQAKQNAAQPLRFGIFPDPGRISGIDSAGFTAKPSPEGGAIVGFNVYELTCDSEQGESCRVHQDWKNFTQYNYTALEPVRIDISELNPNTTFWVQRWRELTDNDQWRQQSFWVLGSSLPDVSKELWDLVSKQNTIAWIDAVLSVLAAASVIAGPLIALEGGLASGLVVAGSSEAAALLTRELIVSAFWFVASEILIQQMLDFDAKINDPANEYSETDKKAWGAFKIAMLVLGGSLLLRSAWKGLRARMSAKLQLELGAMEAEMLKAEAQGLKTAGKAAGVEAAEKAIAKESDELVDMAMESEGKGGLGLFGKKAPPPSGPLSPELKAMYMEQMSSRWLKFKLNLYAKLKGVPLDWDQLVKMVESAEFKEYATWREAIKSVGYAGVDEGQLVLGMAKPMRKIPILAGSSIQHEIVHVFQEMTEGLLTKEAAKMVSYPKILQAEVAANVFGSPGLILTYTGGVIVIVTGTMIVIAKLAE